MVVGEIAGIERWSLLILSLRGVFNCIGNRLFWGWLANFRVGVNVDYRRGKRWKLKMVVAK